MVSAKNENLMTLMDDKDFVVKMMSQETAEDVHKLFQDNGVDISMDEVNELGKELERISQGGDEIDIESLEEVSGGFAITAAGVVLAGKVIVAVGTAGLAIYKWYKSR